jgi:hypothetical protein
MSKKNLRMLKRSGLQKRTSDSSKNESHLLPHPQDKRLLTKQRRLTGLSTICIILLFIIVIVNCLVLGYNLGQLIAEEAESLPRSGPHSLAKESINVVVKAKDIGQLPNPKEATPVIAFLRISKTGSTTLSTFINLHTPLHGLYTQIEKDKNEENGAVGDCLYTQYPISIDGFENNTSNDVETAAKQRHQCFHGYYKDMTEQIKNLSKELHQNLQPRWISMFRDPYDRLVSLFHFSKDNKMYPFSPEQEEMIKNDNLRGWMESLLEPKHLYIPLQHMQLHDRTRNNLERAIALIEGERPIILTLVNECFEASLRLFVEEFGITGKDGTADADIIQDFMNSNRYHERKRPHKYTNDTHDADDLRGKAKEWFHDDFVFYDKVVENFRERMKASVLRSGGDKKHFESCKYFESGRN